MLQDFLIGLAQKPFVWGKTDCALVLADWWLLNHGSDPAAHLRGTYSTEDECWQVLDGRGGMLKLVSDIAASVGASMTDAPKAGDFAVVGVSGLRFGAIRTPSDRWFVKSVHGAVGLSDVRVIRSWSI